MQKKNIVILGIILLSLFSCAKDSKINDNVERSKANTQIVSNELITSMPGALLVYEKELVWMDVRPGEIHILNRKNGKNITTLQPRGGGPEEVITPDIIWSPNRRLTIFDLNGSKKINIPLDSIGGNHRIKKEIIPLNRQFRGLSPIPLFNNKNIFITPDSIHPFLLASDSTSITPFGNYPLKDVENITN